MNRKGNIAGLSSFAVALLVAGIIVVVAMLILTSFQTSINNTYLTAVTLSNSQGTANSTGLNTYINSYINANVSEYNTTTSVNFTGTAPSTVWIKTYVNGVATTSAYHQGKIVNATYAVSAATTTIYKFTVASNSTSYKNVTYYLILQPKVIAQPGNTNANNALTDSFSAFSTIASYLPLIALVVVASIIITIVVVAFNFRRNRREEESYE